MCWGGSEGEGGGAKIIKIFRAGGFMPYSSLDSIIKANVKALDHFKQEMISSNVH